MGNSSLSLFPLLETHLRSSDGEKPNRWTVAQGFQPEKKEAISDKSKKCPWPSSQLFLRAKSRAIDLFVLESDCAPLHNRFPWLRRLPEASEIFKAPHVLITQGFKKVAYAGFDVVFQHAIQGIHGPSQDADLLLFLTAYLRSPLAHYFVFHTSSNWGVSRAKVHLAELLRVPFPLPDQTRQPDRSTAIVKEAASRVRQAMRQAEQPLADRPGIVRQTQNDLEGLIYEYFEVDEVERILIEDTTNIIIGSTRPSQATEDVPTLKASTAAFREEYRSLLCSTLNKWARGSGSHTDGRVGVSARAGLGLVALERLNGRVSTITNSSAATGEDESELISILERLSNTFARKAGSVRIVRGLKVFEGNRLYFIKPLNQRYWTRTAALNDADEVAASVLSQRARGKG